MHASNLSFGRSHAVEFALNVVGVGLVIHACVPDPKKVYVYAGQPIEFVSPDGAVIRTVVRRLYKVHNGRRGGPGLIGFLVPLNIRKEHIPRGTKVRFGSK
jgi:hypothetical protein